MLALLLALALLACQPSGALARATAETELLPATNTSDCTPSWSAWGPSPSACIEIRTQNCSCNSGGECQPQTTTEQRNISNMGSWGSWGLWTAWSSTCLNPTRTRSRNCTAAASCDAGCPAGSAVEVGMTAGSAAYSSWGSWGQWSSLCGFGIRYRSCQQYCGSTAPCPTSSSQSRSMCCPGLEAYWSSWSPGPWDSQCGFARREVTRTCLRPSQACEPNCAGPRVYNETTCCVNATNGVWSAWSAWSETCAAFQVNGTRQRTCSSVCGGAPCPGLGAEARVLTNDIPCCTNWATWAPWSLWTTTCGNGTAVRVRNCSLSANYSSICTGSFCLGPSQQSRSRTNHLAVDGSWSPWTLWTMACGNQTRLRTCSNPPPSCDGRHCSGQETAVGLYCCAFWNNWVSWSPWAGACSGPQTRNRTRTCGTICAIAGCQSNITETDFSSRPTWNSCCPGSYGVLTNNTCQPCTACSLGYTYVSACNGTSDAVCAVSTCSSVRFSSTFTGANLVGVTNDTISTICSAGYAFNRNASYVSENFTCTAMDVNRSIWQPPPVNLSCLPLFCTPINFSRASPATISGPVPTSITVTCNNGYVFPGGASAINFRCLGVGLDTDIPHAVAWSPEPPSGCIPASCPLLNASDTTVGAFIANGTTNDVRNITCATGWTIGGRVGNPTGQSYTCTGTAPGVSVWSPSPSALASRCEIVLCSFPTLITEAGATINTNFARATYNNDQFCQWTVRAPADAVPMLVATSFATESNYDWVTIYDGPTTGSPQIARRSGTASSQRLPVIGSQPNAVVTFTSDSSATSTGVVYIVWFLSRVDVTISTSEASSRTMTLSCNGPCGFLTPINSVTGANAPAQAHWGPTAALIVSLSTPGLLTGLALAVDSNDDYKIEVSTDGLSWMWLTTVPASAGLASGGFDVFTSNASSPSFHSSLSFLPTYTSRIRVTTTAGDGYSVLTNLSLFFATSDTLPLVPITTADSRAPGSLVNPDEARYQVMIASHGAELLLSSDFGLTWGAVAVNRIEYSSAGYDNGGGDMFSTTLAAANVSLCQALCERTTGCNGYAMAVVSVSCGSTPTCWIKSTPGATSISSCRVSSTLRSPWQRAAISSSGQVIAATTMFGLHLSTNFGQSFTKAWTTLISGGFWHVAVSASGRYITIASGGTIHVSSNTGATWTLATFAASSNTLSATVSLVMSDNGQYQVIAESWGLIWASTSYGSQWRVLSTNGQFYGRIAISSSARYLIASVGTDGWHLGDPRSRGRVWFSTDGGATLSTRIGGMNSFWWSAVAMSQTGRYAVAVGGFNDIYAGNGCMLYVSSNFGVDFTQVPIACYAGLTDGWSNVAMSGSGRFISATTSRGRGNNFGRVYVSSDFGATWVVTGPVRQNIGFIAISSGVTPCSVAALVSAFNISGTLRTSPAIDFAEMGQRVNFSCFAGADFVQLNGPSFATCLSNGTFVLETTTSGPNAPTCTSIRCPMLAAPTDGSVSVSAIFIENQTNIIPGATALFSCASGYRLIGSLTSACTARGTWTLPGPSCVLAPCPIVGYDALAAPPTCRCAIGYVNCSFIPNLNWTFADLLFCPAMTATTNLVTNVAVPSIAFNTSTIISCPMSYTLRGMAGASTTYEAFCLTDGAPDRVRFSPMPNCTLVACPIVGYQHRRNMTTGLETCICRDGFAQCGWNTSTTSWNAAVQCAPGFYARNDSASCLACAAGTWSKSGAAQCVAWSVCGDPLVEYQLVPPSPSNDRVCRLYDIAPTFSEPTYTVTISQQATVDGNNTLRQFVANQVQVAVNTQNVVFTYTLADPSSAAPFVSVNARTGELHMSAPVPLTSQYQYTLLVTATDNRTLCYEYGKAMRAGGCSTQATLTLMVAAFTYCPSNQRLYITNGTNTAARFPVVWETPQTNSVVKQLALDPDFQVSNTYSPGDSFPLGTTEVIYRTTTFGANQALSCRFKIVVSLGARLLLHGVGSRRVGNSTLNYIMSGVDAFGGSFTFPLMLADLAYDSMVFHLSSNTGNAFQLLQTGDAPITAQLTFGICQVLPVIGAGMLSPEQMATALSNYLSSVSANVTFLHPILKDETIPPVSSTASPSSVATISQPAMPTWRVTSRSLDTNCVKITATASVPARASFSFEAVLIAITTNVCSDGPETRPMPPVSTTASAPTITTVPFTTTTPPATGTLDSSRTTSASSSGQCTDRTPGLLSLVAPRSFSALVFNRPPISLSAAAANSDVFISLKDTTAPIAQGCPGDIHLTLPTGSSSSFATNTSSAPTSSDTPGDQMVFSWIEPTFFDNVGVIQVTGPFARVLSGSSVSLLLAAKNSPHSIVYRAMDAANNVGECIFSLVIDFERLVQQSTTTLSRVTVANPILLARRGATAIDSDDGNSSLVVLSNSLEVPLFTLPLTSNRTNELVNVLQLDFRAPAGLRFVLPSQRALPGLVAVDFEMQLALLASDCPPLARRQHIPLGDEFATMSWSDLQSLAGSPIPEPAASGFEFVSSSQTLVSPDLDAARAVGLVSSAGLLDGFSTGGFTIKAEFPRTRNISHLATFLSVMQASQASNGSQCTTRALTSVSTQSHLRFNFYFTPRGFELLRSRQLLLIKDFTPPVWVTRVSNFTVIANSNPTTTADSVGAFITWTEPVAQDNIAVVFRNRTRAPGDWFALNSDLRETVYKVHYSAFDAAGNTASTSFFVTLVDHTRPTCSCPALVRLPYNASNADLLASLQATLWPAVSVNDNSARLSIQAVLADSSGANHTLLSALALFNRSSASWKLTLAPPTMLLDDPAAPFVPSNYTITISVVDTAGNAASLCVTRFEVYDSVPPVFTTCPNRIDLFYPDPLTLELLNTTEAEFLAAEHSEPTFTAHLNWTLPLATDNYALHSVSTRDENGTAVSPGTQTLTLARTQKQATMSVYFTATDRTGNTAWCNSSIVLTNLLISASGSITTSTSASGPLGSNLPIVIGAGAGGAVLIVLIVAIVLFRRARRQKPADYSTFLDKLSFMLANSKTVDAETGKAMGPRRPREINREHVKILEQIGMGQFGTVDKALLAENRAIPAYLCAVKQLKSLESHDISALMEESAVMAQLDCEFCISLIGVVTIGRPMMMVVEYCEYGSLLSYLRKHEAVTLPELVRATLAGDCAEGLAYLSTIGLIHRDVSARNVLVSSERRAKLSDFGMSREVEETEYYHSRGGALPVRWSAPEVLENRKFSFKSDIWAAGILLYEIWTYGAQPYGDWSNQRVWVEVTAGKRLPPPPGCCDEVYDIMYDCWRAELDERPDAAEMADRLRKYQARVQAEQSLGSSYLHVEEDEEAPVGNGAMRLYDNGTFDESVEMEGTASVAETSLGNSVQPLRAVVWREGQARCGSHQQQQRGATIYDIGVDSSGAGVAQGRGEALGSGNAKGDFAATTYDFGSDSAGHRDTSAVGVHVSVNGAGAGIADAHVHHNAITASEEFGQQAAGTDSGALAGLSKCGRGSEQPPLHRGGLKTRLGTCTVLDDGEASQRPAATYDFGVELAGDATGLSSEQSRPNINGDVTYDFGDSGNRGATSGFGRSAAGEMKTSIPISPTDSQAGDNVYDMATTRESETPLSTARHKFVVQEQAQAQAQAQAARGPDAWEDSHYDLGFDGPNLCVVAGSSPPMPTGGTSLVASVNSSMGPSTDSGSSARAGTRASYFDIFPSRAASSGVAAALAALGVESSVDLPHGHVQGSAQDSVYDNQIFEREIASDLALGSGMDQMDEA